MTKTNLFLIGLVIGCFTFSICAIKETKEIKKELTELKEENNYLKWQLNEVPTVIESYKKEICDEQE